jgi:hypothetical protein
MSFAVYWKCFEYRMSGYLAMMKMPQKPHQAEYVIAKCIDCNRF